MTPSLSSSPWDDYHRPPAPELLEPKNPKSFDIISHKLTAEALEVTYYTEGVLKELFISIDRDDLWKWAVDNKEIHQVYEMPFYDPESDEEYLVIYPPTAEPGTAEQINAIRFDSWLKELQDEGLERIVKVFHQ